VNYSLRRRRAAAWVGIGAILFQALLFAWHHHPLPFSRPDPTAIVAAADGAPTPALADDDCPLCFGLVHHSAAPIDFIAPPCPDLSLLAIAVAATTTDAAGTFHPSFRPRAPPLV